MRSIKPIAVVGAGSWGTALAMLLASNDQSVNISGWDEDQLHVMHKQRCNHRYLPYIPFPDSLSVKFDEQTTLEGVNDIILAVPAKGIQATLKKIKPYVHSGTRIILASKGLDPTTLSPLHEIIYSELGDNIPLSVISGPTFAIEVAKRLPTAITIASNNESFALEFSGFFAK